MRKEKGQFLRSLKDQMLGLPWEVVTARQWNEQSRLVRMIDSFLVKVQ
jgi:hypothetical protein